MDIAALEIAHAKADRAYQFAHMVLMAATAEFRAAPLGKADFDAFELVQAEFAKYRDAVNAAFDKLSDAYEAAAEMKSDEDTDDNQFEMEF